MKKKLALLVSLIIIFLCVVGSRFGRGIDFLPIHERSSASPTIQDHGTLYVDTSGNLHIVDENGTNTNLNSSTLPSGTSDQFVGYDTSDSATALDPESAREAMGFTNNTRRSSVGVDFGTAISGATHPPYRIPFDGDVVNVTITLGSPEITGVSIYKSTGEPDTSDGSSDEFGQIAITSGTVRTYAVSSGTSTISAGDYIIFKVFSTSGTSIYSSIEILKDW